MISATTKQFQFGHLSYFNVDGFARFVLSWLVYHLV
jgi:hypothetical protein